MTFALNKQTNKQTNKTHFDPIGRQKRYKRQIYRQRKEGKRHT